MRGLAIVVEGVLSQYPWCVRGARRVTAPSRISLQLGLELCQVHGYAIRNRALAASATGNVTVNVLAVLVTSEPKFSTATALLLLLLL